MLSFAIVIPNLNQSHFLSSALDSLRHQRTSFNLALMDGGSTDSFREVAGKYSDIITFLHSGPDAGQAAAIREGFDKIKGDIVAWINADDYYLPGALDKVSSCFENDPDLDVVYGDAVHVNPEGFFLSYFPAIQEFNAQDLMHSIFICQPACFVRRSAYEEAGGVDPTLQYTMDWDLWCRLALNGAKFLYLHDVLAAVRYYPETKTFSGSRLRYKEIRQIERKYGHRVIPLSWMGFYFYDLRYKKRKAYYEKIAFTVLRLLRNWKKRFFRIKYSKNESNTIIYGFQRWEPVVEQRCVIHLPWYDKRQWRRLCLHVEPGSETYNIRINDIDNSVSAKGGLIFLDVPYINQPYRKIVIECAGRRQWKLLRFWCELD